MARITRYTLHRNGTGRLRARALYKPSRASRANQPGGRALGQLRPRRGLR